MKVSRVHGRRAYIDWTHAYLPKVLNHNITLGVATVVGVLLPVIDIDVSNTADQQLKLTLIKNVDKVSWNQLVEAGHEGIELLLDSLLNTPLGDEPSRVESVPDLNFIAEGNLLNVFPLVLVGDLNVLSARLQIHSHLLTEPLVLH